MVVKFPRPQERQYPAAALLYVRSGHNVKGQAASRVPLGAASVQNLPNGHAVHVSAVDAPVTEEY